MSKTIAAIEAARIFLREAERGLAEAQQECTDARLKFLEAREDRIETVAGTIGGDAGIAWTNEARAEHQFNSTFAILGQCQRDLEECHRDALDALDALEDERKRNLMARALA